MTKSFEPQRDTLVKNQFFSLLNNLKEKIREAQKKQQYNNALITEIKDKQEREKQQQQLLNEAFENIKIHFENIFQILAAWSDFYHDNHIYSTYSQSLYNVLPSITQNYSFKSDSQKEYCNENNFTSIEEKSKFNLEFGDNLGKRLSAWQTNFHTNMLYLSREKSWLKLDGRKTYSFYFTLTIAACALFAIGVGLLAGPVLGALAGVMLGLFVYAEVEIKAVKKQAADMHKLHDDMNKNINGVIAASKQLKDISLFKNTFTPKKPCQNNLLLKHQPNYNVK